MSIYHPLTIPDHECDINCHHRIQNNKKNALTNALPLAETQPLLKTWEETMDEDRRSKKQLAIDILISVVSLPFPLPLLMKMAGDFAESKFSP